MSKITYNADSKTAVAPVAASTAISRGDLMWYDVSNEVAKPASDLTDGGTEVLNQRNFARQFLGVSLDTRLAGETTAGEIVIATELVREMDCVAADYDFGDLVAVDEAASGTELEDAKVVKTTDAATAIGQVVKNTGAGATKVFVLLKSRYFDPYRGNGFGTQQTVAVNAETLAGNKTLVLSDAMVQVLDPGGSARNVILPDVAAAKGMMYIIRNSADAAEIITVQNAGASTICTPTQNETAWVFSDGTTWYGLVGSHN